MISFGKVSKFKTLLVLILIITLAAFLRIYKLNEFPPGFYTDEASIGFNAYKIITTLHDEHGQFLPLFFEAFGEYKNSFAIYPVTISYWIFGISEYTTRLPQALIGVAVVFFMYFLAKELFNKKVGLISSFIIATTPWHVHLSRFTIESHNTFLLWIVLGTTLLMVSYRKNWESKFLIATSISFALAFYTYFATRIFTPLYLLGLFLIFSTELLKLAKTRTRIILLVVMIFILIILPFAFHMLSGKGFARYNQVAFNNEDSRPSVLIQRANWLYLNHFNLNFIFFTGDSDFEGQLSNRNSVNGLGLLYKWQLPFWVLGLCFLIAQRGRQFKKEKLIILLMLLLFPLASVVSDAKTPYATRSVIGVVPYTLVTAYGLFIALKYIDKLKKGNLKINLLLLATLLIAITGSLFLNRFLNLYQAYINRASGYNGFQYGAKQIVDYFLENNNRYRLKIIYSGFDGTDAYIKFYGLENCKDCYHFDPEPCNESVPKLIAVSLDNNSEFKKSYNFTLKKEIYYKDGKKAFEIFEAFSACS